jgi:hypothetical protein
MFRSTRDDTLIKTIEDRYGVDLHARGDTKLGNLLEKRGFDSVTQLMKAYRCQLNRHACKRRIYLSFHIEDLPQVGGFSAHGACAQSQQQKRVLYQRANSNNYPKELSASLGGTG